MRVERNMSVDNRMRCGHLWLGFSRIALAMTASLLLSAQMIQAQTEPTNLKFDFGPGKVKRGYTQVVETTIYSKERGYGFEPGSAVSCVDRGGKDALRSDQALDLRRERHKRRQINEPQQAQEQPTGQDAVP